MPMASCCRARHEEETGSPASCQMHSRSALSQLIHVASNHSQIAHSHPHASTEDSQHAQQQLSDASSQLGSDHGNNTRAMLSDKADGFSAHHDHDQCNLQLHSVGGLVHVKRTVFDPRHVTTSQLQKDMNDHEPGPTTAPNAVPVAIGMIMTAANAPSNIGMGVSSSSAAEGSQIEAPSGDFPGSHDQQPHANCVGARGNL